MKFIHAADLHLDSPFKGIRDYQQAPTDLWKILHNAPFQSFQMIIDAAIQDDVDFVLLAGDLFDSNNQSVEAISFLTKQLQRLDDHEIPVMLSFGNHDYQPDGDANFSFPKNVFVFPSEVTTHVLTLRDGKTVAITGFSYDKRSLSDDMVSQFPKRSKEDFQIGMVHGAERAGKDNNYAPFTVNELQDLGYDYWALGHIHKRMELSDKPLIEYPGDIQGRHKNEPGEKGYLLVTDDSGKLSIEFEPTSPVVWSTLNVNISEQMDNNEISNLILDKIDNANFNKLNLVQIKLKVDTDLPNLSSDDILNQVQEKLHYSFKDVNAWIYEVATEEKKSTNFTNLDQEFWDNTKDSVFSNDNVNALAKKLFQNSFIRENFDNDNGLADILNKSMNLISKESGRGSQDED